MHFRPGGIGRYVLPPVTLALGPRASAVRGGETTLAVACGEPSGCRGVLRLGVVGRRDGVKRYRTEAKGSYDLAPGEVKRVRVRFFRKIVESLREAGTYPFYVEAVAGPAGKIQARRGRIVLALGGRLDGT